MTRARVLDPRSVLTLGAMATLYVALIVVQRSAMFDRAPTVISAAIAFDLTLTASALVWWLGVRRAGWPRWTVAITFSLGLAAGRTFLPGGVVVTALIGAWMLVETAIVALMIRRIRLITRVARAHEGPGPIAAVEAGLRAARVPGRAASIIATDLVALGLGIGGWFRRAARDGFAMHRRKSWSAIVGILLFLIAAESFAVHLLVALWSPVAAWIVTGLSIYSAIWFAGDLHAIRLYPVRITPDTVVVSIGLRWRVAIPRAAISAITLCDATPAGALSMSLVEPTVLIALAHPIEVRGLFGIRRTPSAISLTIDEPERFIAALA